MGDPDSKPAKPDPVAERKKQNPAHTDLTTFFFVEHETFELLGGPWGDSDKYKEKLDLGPRALDPDEFWPWASVALQKAQKSRALAGYVAKHNVRDRWVYAFSVEKGQDPVLRFELRLDAKGRVSFLGRDDFLAIHGDPKADDQDDAAYLKRPQWKNTGQAFFKQKIPIGKAGAPIKWHFFGMSFRLTKGGVDEIEADASLLQPDPGFNFFAKDKDASKVEGVKIWKVSRLVPVGDGVLVRVFDPMTVLSNLRKQLHLRLDEFIHYTTPMQGDGNAEIRRRRHLVAAIANHANLVCERSSNVDIRHKELKRGSDVWPKLRNSCFTDAERVILDAEKVTPSAYDAPTFFMEMERRLRDNLLRRQVKAGTALMLWLSSKPWGLVERQSLTSDVRANAFAHLPLRASSPPLRPVDRRASPLRRVRRAGGREPAPIPRSPHPRSRSRRASRRKRRRPPRPRWGSRS
ncbi:MAG: hypothetical protein K0V04_28350, partial [Deltaproteobacteria bacterium]|nr:hypothetical protein [Deltaproteobacteria bacterium]